MIRTPEPELMLAYEQASAYAAADLSDLHEPMLRSFTRHFGPMQSGRLLDLGCGAADITVRFVVAFPGVTALGIDGSDAMLLRGRQRVQEYGCENRVVLQRRYLPDSSLENERFDAVVANSLLHHLADASVLWRTVRACARPGGAAMVMDLRRPADLKEVRRLIERHASDAPPVLRQDFFNSLCAAYSPDEIRAQLNSAGLPHFNVQTIGDLHVIAWGRA